MALFRINFFSESYQRSTKINVLLPADAPAPPGAKKDLKPFKTLYLLHGYRGNCDDWLHYSLIADMSMKFGIAVVMPEGVNGGYVDQPRSGILGSSFIGRELVDFTRRTFPLSERREDTIIAGLSMGGYGTLYNSMKHGGVFGHAIALSTPVKVLRFESECEPEERRAHQNLGYYEAVHGDVKTVNTTDRNIALHAKHVIDSGKPVPNLYMACGYNDMLVPENRELHEQLLGSGFPHVYEEGPGTHDWPFWNEFLFRGLIHVLGEPEIPPHPFWVEKTKYAISRERGGS